jgi:hypothetical protein
MIMGRMMEGRKEGKIWQNDYGQNDGRTEGSKDMAE